MCPNVDFVRFFPTISKTGNRLAEHREIENIEGPVRLPKCPLASCINIRIYAYILFYAGRSESK
jgi:hypothetical protein